MFSRKKVQSDIQRQRAQQIQELKRLNPTIICRQDGRTFDLPINTHNCRFLLSIRLSDNFPSTSPLIKVSVPGLQHPWITSDGFVRGNPQIDNWNSHCVLGTIVRNIVSKFLADPPVTQTNSSVEQSSAQTNSRAQTSSVENPTKSVADDTTLNRIVLPSIPNRIDPLHTLSIEQLRKLNTDEHKYTAFLHSLNIFEGVSSLKADMQKDLLQLARENLTHQETVEQVSKDVIKMRSKITEETVAYEALEQRRKKVMKKYSPLNLSTLLAEKADISEEQSENARLSFSEEKIDEANFVKAYIKAREKYHFVMALRERLMETHGLS